MDREYSYENNPGPGSGRKFVAVSVAVGAVIVLVVVLVIIGARQPVPGTVNVQPKPRLFDDYADHNQAFQAAQDETSKGVREKILCAEALQNDLQRTAQKHWYAAEKHFNKAREIYDKLIDNYDVDKHTLLERRKQELNQEFFELNRMKPVNWP